MPNIPILGQGGNGRPAMHALPGKHAIEITTTDGAKHRLEFDFGLPVGNGGAADLGALGPGFNPQAQAHANMLNLIGTAWANPRAVSISVVGAEIVIRHIVSFRYLGPVAEVPADADADADASAWPQGMQAA